MTIGIDISQMVYEGTGVAMYVREMVKALVSCDTKNTYILFGSSFRNHGVLETFVDQLKKKYPQVKGKLFWFPPSVLDLFWNRLHVVPITWLIGPVDIFWSSDWTQPPLGKAKGITTIHDITILKTKDVMAESIRAVHQRKLLRSKSVCSIFLCDSEATKKDVREVLGIPAQKLRVVYPGFCL